MVNLPPPATCGEKIRRLGVNALARFDKMAFFLCPSRQSAPPFRMLLK